MEPLQCSSHLNPTNSQGGATSPLTLGCVVSPLRGSGPVETNRIWQNLELLNLKQSIIQHAAFDIQNSTLKKVSPR